MDADALVGGFFAKAVLPPGFDALFEHLPDTYFFVKDAHGRFVRVNRAFVELVQAETEAEVLGKRDDDFFPSVLAETYASDDRAVLASGQTMQEKAELMQLADGRTDWFCTTKLAVLDAARRPIGVCGVTRGLKPMSTCGDRLSAWQPIIEAMLSDYANPPDTLTMAKRFGLSLSQFTRQFRRRFGTTPRAYLMGIRMGVVRHLLVTSELPVAEIAQRVGFYDQSHLTNQFARAHGISPSRYRIRHAV